MVTFNHLKFYSIPFFPSVSWSSQIYFYFGLLLCTNKAVKRSQIYQWRHSKQLLFLLCACSVGIRGACWASQPCLQAWPCCFVWLHHQWRCWQCCSALVSCGSCRSLSDRSMACPKVVHWTHQRRTDSSSWILAPPPPSLFLSLSLSLSLSFFLDVVIFIIFWTIFVFQANSSNAACNHNTNHISSL